MNAKPLELEDLTPEQYQYFLRNVWNGVGSQEYAIKPPELCFALPSVRHDFYYWRGGTEADRLAADRRFLADALVEARRYRGVQRAFYVNAAYLYFYGLRALGTKAFEYGERPCQTWDELLARVIAEKGGVKKAIVKNLQVAYLNNVLGGLWEQKLAI